MLKILEITGVKIFRLFFRSQVGIGSKSHVFDGDGDGDGDDLMIFLISSSRAGVNSSNGVILE